MTAVHHDSHGAAPDTSPVEPPSELASDELWLRKREEALRDPRSTAEIVRLAMEFEDEADVDDDCWNDLRGELVALLQYRGTDEVFDAACDLCRSPDPKARRLGVDILGQNLSHWKEFKQLAAPVLLALLERETEPCVLTRIGIAFGALDVVEAIEPMSRLRSHPSADVRWGVMSAMSGYECHELPLAQSVLIELSADEDEDVRNWTTFTLGSLSDLDSEALRDALVARLDDPNEEIRGEACVGLARRRDARVLEPLKRALAAPFEWMHFIKAAGELADPSLLPLLLDVKEGRDADPTVRDLHRDDLIEAIEACQAALQCEQGQAKGIATHSFGERNGA